MHQTLPKCSNLAQSLKLGVYRHFKGGEYELVGVARLEADMAEVVVYKALRDDSLWVRTVENFTEAVTQDGYTGPRFVWVRDR